MLLAALAALLVTGAPASPPVPPPVVVSKVPTQAKKIAFTFDDGPNVSVTPQVIAMLQERGARATFFLMGQEAEKNPAVVKQLRAAGMEIANHGMHHRYLRSDDAGLALGELREAETAIMRAGASRPTLFRLPGGIGGPRVLGAVSSAGYRIIGWSIDPRDSIRGTTASQIAQTILREASPGAIVLLHDGPPIRREATLTALRQVLPSLERQGYTFCSVGELLRSARIGS